MSKLLIPAAPTGGSVTDTVDIPDTLFRMPVQVEVSPTLGVDYTVGAFYYGGEPTAIRLILREPAQQLTRTDLAEIAEIAADLITGGTGLRWVVKVDDCGDISAAARLDPIDGIRTIAIWDDYPQEVSRSVAVGSVHTAGVLTLISLISTDLRIDPADHVDYVREQVAMMCGMSERHAAAVTA